MATDNISDYKHIIKAENTQNRESYNGCTMFNLSALCEDVLRVLQGILSLIHFIVYLHFGDFFSCIIFASILTFHYVKCRQKFGKPTKVLE